MTAYRSRGGEMRKPENAHWLDSDCSLPKGEKRRYSGKELERFRKLYIFEMRNYLGEIVDVTEDVEELWEQGGRGFYSAILTKAGPPEVCCFNIPNEIKMTRRS